MKTQAIFFGFDQFGSGGTASGVSLLADALREIVADNRRETVETRAKAYSEHLKIREVSFVDLDALADWRRTGRRLARAALRAGDFLLWFSGNHLGVLPLYDELSSANESVLVVQLDAHLDIHHFRICHPELSHGNFLLHVAGAVPPLVNVGHRDLLLPADYIARTFKRTYQAMDFFVDPALVLKGLRQLADKADRVYLDIDCDVFDPGHFPAVAQPVPFGLSPDAVLRILDAVWSDKVGGVFVSEFDPGRDRDDRSLSALMWLIEYLLLRRYEQQ